MADNLLGRQSAASASNQHAGCIEAISAFGHERVIVGQGKQRQRRERTGCTAGLELSTPGVIPWACSRQAQAGARLAPGKMLDWHVHQCTPWAGCLKLHSGPTPHLTLKGFWCWVTGDMGRGTQHNHSVVASEIILMLAHGQYTEGRDAGMGGEGVHAREPPLPPNCHLPHKRCSKSQWPPCCGRY